MAIEVIQGDPLRTEAQVLAFAHNALGRSEMGAFETRLMQTYPAAFAGYRKHIRAGRLATGQTWRWTDSTPELMAWVVRASPVGATRLRYVQAIALAVARDYRREMIRSLAIAPLARPEEWPEVMKVLTTWLDPIPLPVTIYERYEPL